MAARGPYYVDKDAWVAQLVGGTVEYGNGSGTLIMIGPVPQAGGGADFKSRGMFSISATDMAALMSGASDITSATVTLTVGANTCIGTRGSTIRLFLEEMTSSFDESATTGCNLNAHGGVNAGWNTSNNAVKTNRASYSGAPGLGAAITFDITAIVAARFAANNTGALRFRVISANSTLTDYDETTTQRRIAVSSREDGTLANEPQLSAVVATAPIAKTLADTGTGTEGFSVSQSGTAPLLTETAVGVDALVAGPIATWSTGLDANSNGRASLFLPTVNQTNYALLTTGAVGDIQLRCRVQVNKIPTRGSASFMLLARAIDKNNHYRARMVMGGTDHSIGVYLEKVVAGVVTDLQHVLSIRTLIADTDFWLKLQVKGTSPTTLNAKVWRWGDAEPGWLLQVNDSQAALQANGDTGMGGSLSATVNNAPVTMYMDQYEGYAP